MNLPFDPIDHRLCVAPNRGLLPCTVGTIRFGVALVCGVGGIHALMTLVVCCAGAGVCWAMHACVLALGCAVSFCPSALVERITH